MTRTRRGFLKDMGKLLAALGGALVAVRRLPGLALARGVPGWRVRRATGADAALVAEIFNAHIKAKVCAFSDRIVPWTVERARAFVGVYNGTLILYRGRMPVGFGALIDYSDPNTVSSIAPGVEPKIPILALRYDQLDDTEALAAGKALTAAMARDLRRMGFDRCRAVIHPRRGLFHHYPGLMTVRRTVKRKGVAEALEVSFDVRGGLTALAAEGY